MKNLTFTDKGLIGKKIAEMLMLKKSKNNKERYQTTWGDKTAVGVFETIYTIGKSMETDEIYRLFPINFGGTP